MSACVKWPPTGSGVPLSRSSPLAGTEPSVYSSAAAESSRSATSSIALVTVTACPSGTEAPVLCTRVGESFEAEMVTVRVAAKLSRPPSYTVKLTVRGAVEGSSLVFAYPTDRNAASKPATVAGPVSVSVPLSASQLPVIPPASTNDSTSWPPA